jgi:hypothetical protein
MTLTDDDRKPDLRKEQELTACQIGLSAVEGREQEILSWFTTSVAGLPSEWLPFVAMALLGEQWRRSDSPVFSVVLYAVFSAEKWGQSELAAEFWRLRQKGRPYRDLMDYGRRDGYVESSGDVNCSNNATEEARARMLRLRGVHDSGDPLGSVKDLVKDEYLTEAGDVDWWKLGARVGMGANEIVLLKARATGSANRGSDNEAVWKRLQRKYPRILEELYDAERASLYGVD